MSPTPTDGVPVHPSVDGRASAPRAGWLPSRALLRLALIGGGPLTVLTVIVLGATLTSHPL